MGCRRGEQAVLDVAFTVLGALVGLAAGWLAGFRLGELVSGRPAVVYWALNLLAAVLGVAGSTAGQIAGQPWLWVASIAFMPAAFTGLKYGRGKTVGRGSLSAPEEEQVEVPELWKD